MRQALIAMIVCAPAAVAGTVTSVYVDGDAGFNDLTNGGTLEQAVVESRIGNAAASGTWEVGLWRLGAVGTPLDQANRVIGNGAVANFSLSYDGGTGLTYSIDGVTVASGDIGGSFTDIFIRMRGVSNGTVSLASLQIDGADLDVTSISATDGVEYLRINNMGDEFGAFTLTGTQRFDWTGTQPSNSALATQFKLTNVIPAPAGLAALGCGLLAGSRRRR